MPNSKNGKNGRKNGAPNGNGKPGAEVKLEPKITRFKSNRERVKTLVSSFKKEDRVLILIWADPDAMASALAMKRLIRHRVSEVAIAHVNEIRRVNNVAMMQLLKIPLVKLRQVKASEYNKKILIDSQPPHNPEFMRFQYDVVIDHHPLTTGWEAPFVDIRPEYGAAASILTEYLRSLKIKPSVALSTALIYGIKTDTSNFEKAGPAIRPPVSLLYIGVLSSFPNHTIVSIVGE